MMSKNSFQHYEEMKQFKNMMARVFGNWDLAEDALNTYLRLLIGQEKSKNNEIETGIKNFHKSKTNFMKFLI